MVEIGKGFGWKQMRRGADSAMRKAVGTFGFPFLNRLTTPPTRVYNMEGEDRVICRISRYTRKDYEPQTKSSCFQGRGLIVVGRDGHETGGDVRSRIRVCGTGKMRRLFQRHINNISKQQT